MNRTRHRKVLIAMSVGLLAGSFARAQQVQEAPIIPHRVIVVFNSETLPADAADRVRGAGGKLHRAFDHIGVAVVSPDTVDGATLIQNLRADSAILSVDYDRVMKLALPAPITDASNPSLSGAGVLPHPLPTFSPALPPDFFYTSSPQQWSVKRVGAEGGGIPGGGAGAWDVTKGKGVKIAILDTGINSVHPDLAPNVIFNRALTFYDPVIDGPQNCEVPDTSNPPFDLPADQGGHGTYVASLAAGAIGGGLLIGVAPEASILNIKVLRSVAATPEDLVSIGVPDTPFNRCLFRTGMATEASFLEGVLLASLQGADVISMSLGGYVPLNGIGADAGSRAVKFAYTRGAVLVAAAGNDALNLDKVGDLIFFPAELPNVIAVTATTNPACAENLAPGATCLLGTDGLAFYSNFGSRLHGLAAPGGSFPVGVCGFSGVPCNPTGPVRGACSSGLPGTTIPVPAGYPSTGPPPAGVSWGCTTFYSDVFNGADQHAWYRQWDGTSASTAHVAGVAALVKAANPRLSPDQIRTILQQTAEDIGKPGYDPFFNFGLVNATAAVNAARAQ